MSGALDKTHPWYPSTPFEIIGLQADGEEIGEMLKDHIARAEMLETVREKIRRLKKKMRED